MAKYKKLSILLGLLLSFILSFGQQPHIKRIDGTTISTSAIDSMTLHLMSAARVSGLGLAIINDNKIVYEKMYGYKNIEAKELLDTSTVLYAASLSKAVFTYLCLALVRQGVLDLEKPLYQYLDKPLPEYPKYRDLAGDDRWKLITARMCLSHTTGFPNWRFLDARTGKYVPNGKLAIYFTPGHKFGYSGEGYALLQMVVEKITGNGLEVLAAKIVFEPIGMYRTSYVWQQRFEDNYALGYDENSRPLEKKKWTTAGAAGSMETTLADYARFIQYIMQKKGLNQQIYTLMMTPGIRIYSKRMFPTIGDDSTTENNPIALSTGLGWGFLKTPYGEGFHKGGHDDGWEHYNINFIDKGSSILLMTNSSNGESIFKELLEKIIGDKFTPWQWANYVPYNNR
ncbi:MAG TPA: serine hydrolase domain-containing protein [Puia sp.]|nr:serine hydrolase domain-containing protein [Puia sp.]